MWCLQKVCLGGGAYYTQAQHFVDSAFLGITLFRGRGNGFDMFVVGTAFVACMDVRKAFGLACAMNL